MRGGHQHPFRVYLLEPSQSEPILTSDTLDLIEHRLDDRLAQGVNVLTGLGSELSIHPAAAIKICLRPSLRLPWPLAVLLAAGGDVGDEAPVLAGFQVGGAAVTGVRDQGIRQLTAFGLDPLLHGLQVHCIAGLVAHADGHDHLVVAIEVGLCVVALHPAVSALENVADGVREIPLRAGVGVTGRS